MKKVETLENFYQKVYKKAPEINDIQFNMMTYNECIENNTLQYRRCDFYKVTFLTGHFILHYGDKSLEINGTFLAFFSPDTPYVVEVLSQENFGGFFIFREAYFNDFFKGNIRDITIFCNRTIPIYLLDETGQAFVSNLMNKMSAESCSTYEFKHDLIRSYILELLHYAMKTQPTEKLYHQIDAKTRITRVFFELLNRQFPIESINRPLMLRSAGDYAKKLSVHVNYLNRALRMTTGKTTTEHISERLASEAIALLKHSDWNISEISYSLGFEDSSHFNHFMKKHTNYAPKAFRTQHQQTPLTERSIAAIVSQPDTNRSTCA